MSSRKFLVFIGAFAVLNIFVQSFMSFGGHYDAVSAAFRLICPLIAIYFGMEAMNFFGISSRQGKAVTFMTAALLLSFFGTIPWVLQDSGVSIMLAHFFYIVMRPLFAFGIYYSVLIIEPGILRDKKRVIYALLAVVATAIVYFTLINVPQDSQRLILETIVLNAYIILDFFLFVFAMLTAYFIYVLSRGIYNRVWIAMGLGSLFFWCSQLYYVLNPSSYFVGSFSDLGWNLGFLMFAVAFYFLKANAQKIFNSVPAPKKNIINEGKEAVEDKQQKVLP